MPSEPGVQQIKIKLNTTVGQLVVIGATHNENGSYSKELGVDYITTR